MKAEKETKSRLLTPEEVAERLAVSPITIRNWLRQGRLKGVKISVLWRVREKDLNEFVEGQKNR